MINDKIGLSLELRKLLNEEIKPYKSYVALLSQSGTNDPVATVLENTLGGIPTWTRVGTGLARVTLSGAFTLNKTVIFVNSYYNAIIAPLYNDLTVNTLDLSINELGFGIDDWKSMIEIRVYN